MRQILFILAILGASTAAGRAAPPENDGKHYLMPFSHDAVPPIVDYEGRWSELEIVARAREYATQIRLIQRRHFGPVRLGKLRAEGLEELREFTDPAAFRPMWEILRQEKDDVRLGVLDHFASQDEEGQAALAWVAIHETGEDDESLALKYEATKRLQGPASDPVLAELDWSLRSANHMIANNAASVAGVLDAVETIPLLIFGQAAGSGGSGSSGESGQTGDLAWIAIEHQTVYVRELIPIVNNGAVAFQPIPGIVTEGAVLRAVDAVVVIYRTIVHRVLVNMSTNDWGESTSHLGYDPGAWLAWYKNEYLPYKESQQSITTDGGGDTAGSGIN